MLYIKGNTQFSKNTRLYRCTVDVSVSPLSFKKIIFLSVTKVTVALLYKGAIVRCVRKADADNNVGSSTISAASTYTLNFIF